MSTILISQKIELKYIEKFHGHWCDDLVEGFWALTPGNPFVDNPKSVLILSKRIF